MRGKKFRHDYNSCLVHTDGHYVLCSHHIRTCKILADEDVKWQDYIDTLQEEVGITFTIRENGEK